MKNEQARAAKSLHSTPKGFVQPTKPPSIVSERDEKKERRVDHEPEKTDKPEMLEKPEKPDKTDEPMRPVDTDDDKQKVQNGQSMPPKPLPRSSRANSISEEEPKPVARPRTSPSAGAVVTSVNPNMVGGYKVRIWNAQK